MSMVQGSTAARTSVSNVPGSSQGVAPSEAEALARAAEEARKQAEARMKEAAAAQEKARQDDRAAQAAQKAYGPAEQQSLDAQTALSDAQAELTRFKDARAKRCPSPDDAQQQLQREQAATDSQNRLNAAKATAAGLEQPYLATQAASDASYQQAITQANAALDAQKSANTAAKAAGKSEPFPKANAVRDVYDAGSLDAKAQTELLGAPSVVNVWAAARADAQRVGEATQSNPVEGAAELERQLAASTDPNYRAALAVEAMPHTRKLVEQVASGSTRSEDANAIMKSLANSAALGGPPARTTLATQINAATFPFAAVGEGPTNKDRVFNAIRANGADANMVDLGTEMAKLRRDGNLFEDADAIAQLSPQLTAKAGQTAGQQALRNEVDLNTVAEERTQAETAQQQTDAEARTRATDAIALSKKDPKEWPPGVSFEGDKHPEKATMVLKDEQGNVLERIQADMTYGSVRLESTKFDRANQKADLSVIVSQGPQSTTKVIESSWKIDPNMKDSLRYTDEALRNMDDLNVSYSETEIRRDRGVLVENSFSRDAQTGVTETRKLYDSQQKTDGVNDELKVRFDDTRPLDTVKIRTTNIPPVGTKSPDGKLAKASVTEGTSYSQGGIRATSSQTKAVDSPANEKTSVPYSLLEVEDRAKDAKKAPKSWTFQAIKPGELNTQTFVEGQPDLSVVIKKKIQGNTVEETTEGKVPNPSGKGDPVSIQGTSSKTYDAQGRITSLHAELTDAQGKRQVQDHQRTEARNASGQVEVTERTASSEELPGGQAKRNIEQEVVSLQTDKGPQLVRSVYGLNAPEGNARSTLTPEGQELLINGVPVTSMEDLKAQQPASGALGGAALDGQSALLRDFAARTASIEPSAPTPSEQAAAAEQAQPQAQATQEQQARTDTGERNSVFAANNYGLYLVKKELTTIHAPLQNEPDPSANKARWSKTPVEAFKTPLTIDLTAPQRFVTGATGGVQALTGFSNVYTSINSLIRDIPRGDGLGIAEGVVGLTGGGVSVYV
ncbi:hypothetical protein, partial [Myxococcus sp. CA039A]